MKPAFKYTTTSIFPAIHSWNKYSDISYRLLYNRYILPRHCSLITESVNYRPRQCRGPTFRTFEKFWSKRAIQWLRLVLIASAETWAEKQPIVVRHHRCWYSRPPSLAMESRFARVEEDDDDIFIMSETVSKKPMPQVKSESSAKRHGSSLNSDPRTAAGSSRSSHFSSQSSSTSAPRRAPLLPTPRHRFPGPPINCMNLEGSQWMGHHPPPQQQAGLPSFHHRQLPNALFYSQSRDNLINSSMLPYHTSREPPRVLDSKTSTSNLPMVQDPRIPNSIVPIVQDPRKQPPIMAADCEIRPSSMSPAQHPRISASVENPAFKCDNFQGISGCNHSSSETNHSRPDSNWTWKT